MGLDVLLVLVLVGHGVFVARRLGMGLGEIDRALAEARRRAELVGDHVQVGAGNLQQHLLLQRHPVGHDGAHVVSARPRHRRQADAGIARGGLDDAALPADFATLLQVTQHLPRGAVLDRAERVHPLQLGVQRELRRRIEPVEPHQRRGIVLAGSISNTLS